MRLQSDLIESISIHTQENNIMMIIHYDKRAGARLFRLTKVEDLSFLVATYDTTAQELSDKLEVHVIDKRGNLGSWVYTMSKDEKLIFKEVLITEGLI